MLFADSAEAFVHEEDIARAQQPDAGGGQYLRRSSTNRPLGRHALELAGARGGAVSVRC